MWGFPVKHMPVFVENGEKMQVIILLFIFVYGNILILFKLNVIL